MPVSNIFQSGFFGFINRCQGSECRCQVYGFQSGFLVLLIGVKDLSAAVKYIDSKWFLVLLISVKGSECRCQSIWIPKWIFGFINFSFKRLKKLESSQLRISSNVAVNHVMQESFGIKLLINN